MGGGYHIHMEVLQRTQGSGLEQSWNYNGEGKKQPQFEKISGLTRSSPGQQCYLFVILPVPLEIHATILTALNERPPTSTGLHVTEHLERIEKVGSWKPLEAARSQVWASMRVI